MCTKTLLDSSFRLFFGQVLYHCSLSQNAIYIFIQKVFNPFLSPTTRQTLQTRRIPAEKQAQKKDTTVAYRKRSSFKIMSSFSHKKRTEKCPNIRFGGTCISKRTTPTASIFPFYFSLSAASSAYHLGDIERTWGVGHEIAVSQNVLNTKHKVQDEHGISQRLCHPPLGTVDDEQHRSDHREQNQNRSDNAIGRHFDRESESILGLLDRKRSGKEPRQRQTHQNIKDIATDRRRHRHISIACFRHNNRRQQIRNRRTCCQHGQTHNRIGDICHFSNGRCPPHHKKGVAS